MEDGLLTALAQFGPAGLIGFLWLYERRSSVARERQLDEAHQRVMSLDRQLEALLSVIQDNTRAINCLQQSQRRLTELLDRLSLTGPARAERGCS